VDPSHGTVESDTAGSCLYTPATGYFGADAFEYQVCDDGTSSGLPDPRCDTATVNLTVNEVTTPRHTLTITLAGTGSGTVTSDPAGIDCGATCSALFDEGTGVTLHATPAAGSNFTGWAGDCAAFGTSDCSLTMAVDHAASATFELLPSADVSVSETDTPDPVTGGGNVKYSLTVGNAGPDAASGVSLSDTLPAGTTFVSATPGQGTCGQAAGVVSCDLGGLASGASASVDVIVTTATVTAPTTITNTASVSATEGDPVSANNSSSEDTTVTPTSADVSVSQSDSPDPVTAAGDVNYAVVVANGGPDGATGVTLQDTIPTGSTFVSATPSQGTCSQSSGVVTCLLGSLASGVGANVSVVVRSPTVNTPTTITNTATVSATQGDPVGANNSSSESTTVRPPSTNPDQAAAWVPATGGTVMTGGGKGPTKQDPMTTEITIPAGFAGLVSITETTTTSCPAGFVCFGQQADVIAPTTTATTPLRLRFLILGTAVPKGTKPADVVLFHDGVLVPRCTVNTGAAVPDPCIFSVKKVKSNFEIVALSSRNGSWRGGR
jgi:uncharacterized repeat protein (TIGR01451 family)